MNPSTCVLLNFTYTYFANILENRNLNYWSRESLKLISHLFEPFVVCFSKPIATLLGGFLFSQGSYVCVYSTSLLLFLFAAAAGTHGLYNFQVSAAGWFPLLPRDLCLCVFHVSPPLPLCGCCWHTWAIYTIFRYSAAGLVPRLLRELCLCVFHVSSPLSHCGCLRT